MSRKKLKNVAASVRSRLLTRAKADRLAFNQVLQRYAMERVLYRLSISEYADSFYLKGALLFWVWDLPGRRPTMDIDLLGFMDNSLDAVESVFSAVCSLEVEDDGLVFDMNALRVQRIKEDADYEGVRITFKAGLETAVIALQIDIGFDDHVANLVAKRDFPVLLDMPIPRLQCYPAETVIAEKFEAMVKLELLNSRMKDFYDLWLLSRQNAFEMANLTGACKATFERRRTLCVAEGLFFSEEMKFSEAKQHQWSAFLKKSRISSCPQSFPELFDLLVEFLVPICKAVNSESPSADHWPPGGPWKTSQVQ
jgi:predicted nucleotidyltransferase component of viral defense system